MISFYISSHGFGHVVRQIAIIERLAAMAPELSILVRTNAPEWLFNRLPAGVVRRVAGETDTGMVQIDALRVDEAASIARARAFHDSLEARAAAEADVLRAHGVRLVVADAPALGPAAARAAGIAAVVCANFTWDWIYEEYADVSDGAARVVAAVRSGYDGAAGWRMPFHGGFESFDSVVDVPLVARRARAGSRDEIRAALALPPERRLALVSFGGFEVRDLPLDRLDCTAEWGVVVTSRRAALTNLPRGVHGIAEEVLDAVPVRYEDLVAAVDVVISKPGYGIVADCIAMDTAIVHTPRGRFREYDVLVAEMPKMLRAAPLAMEAFREGRWRDALDAAIARPLPIERPRTDGADVVARMILDRVV